MQIQVALIGAFRVDCIDWMQISMQTPMYRRIGRSTLNALSSTSDADADAAIIAVY